jgi:glycosyltransferase involved in cell wall biosynthesis
MVTMPHVQVNLDWNACAYTNKDVKFARMAHARGHHITMYANEGSEADVDEMVPILTEAERASWFGSHDKQKLYHLQWDQNEPYWKLFNQRAVVELKKRVKRGDFILSLSGNCHQPIANEFPGCYSGVATGPMWVEYGTGYFGTISKYVVYESETHRAWMRGAVGLKVENYCDAAIPNYFDMDDFVPQESDEIQIGSYTIDRSPYYLFVGRIVVDKGWRIAVDATQKIGAKLILAGQGDTGPLPPHCRFVGHVNIPQRNWLMQNAIATFTPTNFSEPFGGTAVEAQLTGCPAISTDHGAFVETVERRWRCSTFKEFIDAAQAAKELRGADRLLIRQRARDKYSFEAVYPQYYRYFSRLYALWGQGWYEDDVEKIVLPPLYQATNWRRPWPW